MTRVDAAVELALELVDAVRRMEPREVQCALDRADKDATLVVLAAMVDQDRPLTDLLGWVPSIEGSADRHRRRRMTETRRLQPCGTHAAYVRHLDHGEPACGPCTDAHNDYARRHAKATA